LNIILIPLEGMGNACNQIFQKWEGQDYRFCPFITLQEWKESCIFKQLQEALERSDRIETDIKRLKVEHKEEFNEECKQLMK